MSALCPRQRAMILASSEQPSSGTLHTAMQQSYSAVWCCESCLLLSFYAPLRRLAVQHDIGLLNECIQQCSLVQGEQWGCMKQTCVHTVASPDRYEVATPGSVGCGQLPQQHTKAAWGHTCQLPCLKGLSPAGVCIMELQKHHHQCLTPCKAR